MSTDGKKAASFPCLGEMDKIHELKGSGDE
jgi:hypothetical protein